MTSKKVFPQAPVFQRTLVDGQIGLNGLVRGSSESSANQLKNQCTKEKEQATSPSVSDDADGSDIINEEFTFPSATASRCVRKRRKKMSIRKDRILPPNTDVDSAISIIPVSSESNFFYGRKKMSIQKDRILYPNNDVDSAISIIPVSSESDFFGGELDRKKQETIRAVYDLVSLECEVTKAEQAKVLWAINDKLIAETSEKHNLTKQSVWPELPNIEPTEGKKRAKVTSEKTGSIKTVELQPIIIIPAVKPDPRMRYWTEIPFNIHEEENDFLINAPYLGEEEYSFVEQLVESYDDGTVHEDKKNIVITDEILSKIVQRLVIVEKLGDLNPDVRKWFSEDETSIQLKNMKKPSRSIFFAISKVFPEFGVPFEVEKRYLKYRRQTVGKENNTENFSEEDEADSFKSMLCSRCSYYDCIQHDEGDHVDPKYVKKRKSKINTLKPCENPLCILNKNKPVRKPTSIDADSVRAKWRPLEISLYLNAAICLKQYYCGISRTIMTKTCSEVYEFSLTQPCADEVNSDCWEDVNNSEPLVEDTQKRGRRKGLKSRVQGNAKGKHTRWLHHFRTNFEPHVSQKLKPRYMPCTCNHDGGTCDKSTSCGCFVNKTSCEKYCTCPTDCPNRFPGCCCKGSCKSNSCPCMSASRECDPDLCITCKSRKRDPNLRTCRNLNIQQGLGMPISRERSAVSGWGAFLMTAVKKNDFITEYCGEIVSHSEAERRGLVYDKVQHTFLFDLNNHFVLDASNMGSTIRFANSSDNPNCYPKPMLVNGDHRIGMYAKRDITKGEELFFNYHNVLEETNLKLPAATPKKKSKSRHRLRVPLRTSKPKLPVPKLTPLSWTGLIHDLHCWTCHRDGPICECLSCPRAFHTKCVRMVDYPVSTFSITDDSLSHAGDENKAQISKLDVYTGICPECVAAKKTENNKVIRNLTSEEFKKLLMMICSNMKNCRNVVFLNEEDFFYRIRESKNYGDFIVNHMDIKTLVTNIKKDKYFTPKGFLGDAKWIEHNTFVYESCFSKVSRVATELVNICKQDVSDMESCPDCFLRKHQPYNPAAFIEPCRFPHLLAWARYPGFPLWPVKIFSVNKVEDKVNIEFFMDHKKGTVSMKHCYLYYLKPYDKSTKMQKSLKKAVDECAAHIKKLTFAFGQVVLPISSKSLDQVDFEEAVREMFPQFDSNEVTMPVSRIFSPE